MIHYISVENQYLCIAKEILNEGTYQTDRTNVGTYSIFGSILKCDTRVEFPIITAKKINFNSIVSELLWFLKGSTNVNELRALTHGEDNRFNTEKRTIWDDDYKQQGIAERGYTDIYKNTVCGVLYV